MMFVLYERWKSAANLKILTEISPLVLALEPSRFVIYLLNSSSATNLKTMFSISHKRLSSFVCIRVMFNFLQYARYLTFIISRPSVMLTKKCLKECLALFPMFEFKPSIDNVGKRYNCSGFFFRKRRYTLGCWFITEKWLVVLDKDKIILLRPSVFGDP